MRLRLYGMSDLFRLREETHKDLLEHGLDPSDERQRNLLTFWTSLEYLREHPSHASRPMILIIAG